jgi:ferredoxin-NADP reductase
MVSSPTTPTVSSAKKQKRNSGMQIVFDHSQPVGTVYTTFWFKPTQPFFYTAGQFTELYLPHASADNRGLRRWFTISSSPTEPLISITTKFAAHEGSSFKRHLQTLQPGAVIQADEAMGDFVLPKDKTIPVVFVAAGIGVTPVRSIIKWLADTGEERHVSLIQATSTEANLAYADLWQQYPLAYTSLVKRPAAGYTGLSGELTAARILATAPPDARNLYYLSGPEALVEQLTKDLITAGIPDYRVITDYFHGYDTG